MTQVGSGGYQPRPVKSPNHQRVQKLSSNATGNGACSRGASSCGGSGDGLAPARAAGSSMRGFVAQGSRAFAIHATEPGGRGGS